MHYSFKKLLQGNLRHDGGSARLTEIFFDAEDFGLRYLAVEIGGWLNVNEVVVAAERLDAPSGEDGDWTLKVTEQELDKAPRWQGDHDAPEVDISSWPPLVVGPFGGAYAPMLVAGQMADAAAAGHPATKADSLVRKLERGTEWIGLPVFDVGGEQGVIADILFRLPDLSLTTLCLSDDKGQPVRDIPVADIRHLADQGTHVILKSPDAPVPNDRL